MTVAALVLAAGRAQRFGAGADDSKVLALFEGVPMVRRVALTALASRAAPVIVVTGRAADAVAVALADLPVHLVHNGNYATGMAGSLQVGRAALPLQVRGALILLADMPLVMPGTLDRLIAQFDHEPMPTDALVPTFEGRWGNPVLLGPAILASLDELGGDEGARKLLVAPGRVLAFCPVKDRGIEIDVDTPAALTALQGG